MAFTLSITHGTQTEELSFDGEVRLGRTADNDVVIKDAASSRSHARIYEEDGQVFAEDLKSANGTLLNGRPLKTAVVIETGDRLSIGEVTIDYQVAAGPSSTLDGEDDDVDPNETILKPPVSKPAVAASPAPKRKPTTELPASAPTRKPTSEIAAAAPRRPTRPLPVQAEAPAEVAEPTAADRARERRELQRSSMGRVQLLWSELPRPTRIVVGVVGSLALVAMLGGLISAMLPKRVAQRPEPSVLVPNGEPLAASFGEGDGVDFSRRDLKTFSFTFASPTAIVGVLHYQARDCSKDEVTIELNGNALGVVPPDTVEVGLEVVLPPAQLKIGEPNELVFDNVSNPPGSEAWRIWNVSVELMPVPILTAEEATVRARENIERAARHYELRGVGAMNLFLSWREYREAWLLLESVPDRPPELVQIARLRMKEIRPMLDRQCATMLVTYQRAMNQKYPDLAVARQVLKGIPDHFGKEHYCFATGRGLLNELVDLDGVE